MAVAQAAGQVAPAADGGYSLFQPWCAVDVPTARLATDADGPAQVLGQVSGAGKAQKSPADANSASGQSGAAIGNVSFVLRVAGPAAITVLILGGLLVLRTRRLDRGHGLRRRW